MACKPSATCVRDTSETSLNCNVQGTDNVKIASISVTSDVGTEHLKINVDRLGSMVNEIVNRNVNKGTTKIKIEIEITHE